MKFFCVLENPFVFSSPSSLGVSSSSSSISHGARLTWREREREKSAIFDAMDYFFIPPAAADRLDVQKSARIRDFVKLSSRPAGPFVYFSS